MPEVLYIPTTKNMLLKQTACFLKTICKLWVYPEWLLQTKKNINLANTKQG